DRQIDTLRVLLKHGANPNATQNGVTALCLASQQFEGGPTTRPGPPPSPGSTSPSFPVSPSAEVASILVTAGAKPDLDSHMDVITRSGKANVARRPLLEAI